LIFGIILTPKDIHSSIVLNIYISELEYILIIFTEWVADTKAAKNPWGCFSNEIFNNLC